MLATPPFELVVDDLGDNGVRLLVFPYVKPDNYWAVRNDLRERIKARFDEAGVRFALPERNLRFPIVDELLTSSTMSTVRLRLVDEPVLVEQVLHVARVRRRALPKRYLLRRVLEDLVDQRRLDRL